MCSSGLFRPGSKASQSISEGVRCLYGKAQALDTNVSVLSMTGCAMSAVLLIQRALVERLAFHSEQQNAKWGTLKFGVLFVFAYAFLLRLPSEALPVITCTKERRVSRSPPCTLTKMKDAWYCTLSLGRIGDREVCSGEHVGAGCECAGL